MSFTRRNALSFASGLAAVGGTTVPAFARNVLDAASGAGLRASADAGDQQFRTLVIHRDTAGGAHHFATISIKSPDTAWVAYGSLDSAAYREALGKYHARGYRLRRVAAFHTANGLRYSAIWQHAGGPAWDTHQELNLARLQQLQGEYARREYRPVAINACDTPDGVRYAAIWESGATPATEVRANLSATEYRQTFETLTAQGFRPRQVSSHRTQGETRFAAIFDRSPSTGWEAEHEMSVATFERKSAALEARGYILTDVSGYAVGNRPVFSGIWEKA